MHNDDAKKRGDMASIEEDVAEVLRRALAAAGVPLGDEVAWAKRDAEIASERERKQAWIGTHVQPKTPRLRPAPKGGGR